MKTLYFDTETNGKILKNRPIPYITQLSAILVDDDFNIQSQFTSLVATEGRFEVPKEEFFINNNMSTERCNNYGLPLAIVLAYFNNLCRQSDRIVAYNLWFDEKIINGNLERLERPSAFEGKLMECAMLRASPILKIPATTKYYRDKGEFKWPTLEESYRFFYGKDMENAHDALYDVERTIDVDIKLLELGV